MTLLKQTQKSSYAPLVSVIIGNYNYERFIKEAIDSALNQTYENIEVIVVDDGSNDNSREIIASYGDKVIPVFQENGGQPSCYNTGFASSRGDIICFLDSDDIFLPNKIIEIVRIFDYYKDISWCFHSLQLIDENNKPLTITTTPNYVTRECDFRARLKSGKIPPNLPPSSALTFKRKLLEQILPMPTTKAVPASDCYIKYMTAALSKGFILAENLTLQRIHNNNMATLRKDKKHMKAREHLFTGYWIRQKFPEFKKIANKLFAVGTYMNWQDGNKDPENKEMMHKYMNSISWKEQMEVNFVALYYYFSIQILNY
jgi:glycosyltransferase involved in cell wall biosynthesis